MTVAVRTNLVTNPSSGAATTGYAAVAGTGGTAALTRVTSGGSTTPTFSRVTWSVATTAIGGGCTYGSVTGIVAGTAYAMSVWVRSSITQTMYIGMDWNTAGGGYISTTGSAAASLTANVWTQVFVTGTAPATATQGNLSALATTGGANWSVGATLDVQGLLVETGTTQGLFFDGSTANTTGLPTNYTYAWTGTANASTSTQTTRTVTMSAVQITQSNGCPGAQITIQDAGTAATYKTSVTRLCESVTNTVPGATIVNLTDAAVINDYAVPLARTVTYALIYNGLTVCSAAITVTSATAWVQDPLRPDKGLPIKLDGNNPGYLTMEASSLDEVTYQQASNKATVLGSTFPVALGGQPQEASGVTIVLFSDDKTTTDSFRAMKKGSPILLFRPLTGMDPLPALAYMAPTVKEKPVNFVYGGVTDSWHVTGDIIAAVRQAITSGYVTYQNVQDLITTGNTYAQVQTKSAAKTYLNWQQNPQIWSTL